VPLEGLNLDGPPSTPRPSATVLLVRGRRPWELLLMRRPRGADFAPGAYVFPGGAVNAQDSESGDEIRAAAIRELFEEVGILLARSGRRLAREAECVRVRSLVEGGLAFGEAMRDCGLTPALDGLVMLARWVTPAQMRKRFDARFFLARVPAGQVVHPQEGEVTDWLWIAPDKALRDQRITLVYATRKVLESVATGEDVRTMFARARSRRDLPTVEPRMVRTDAGWMVTEG
jgi:recombination protein RecT